MTVDEAIAYALEGAVGEAVEDGRQRGPRGDGRIPLSGPASRVAATCRPDRPRVGRARLV